MRNETIRDMVREHEKRISALEKKAGIKNTEEKTETKKTGEK